VVGVANGKSHSRDSNILKKTSVTPLDLVSNFPLDSLRASEPTLSYLLERRGVTKGSFLMYLASKSVNYAILQRKMPLFSAYHSYSEFNIFQ
jgi:hypothetical protein